MRGRNERAEQWMRTLRALLNVFRFYLMDKREVQSLIDMATSLDDRKTNQIRSTNSKRGYQPSKYFSRMKINAMITLSRFKS